MDTSLNGAMESLRSTAHSVRIRYREIDLGA